MSIVRSINKERGRDADASRFINCCGVAPFAYHWEKLQLTSVMCFNKECGNHAGVLAADVDIATKWNKYAKKEHALRFPATATPGQNDC